MEELVRKINDGRYKLACGQEQAMVETCLFLLECLQTIEDHRIKIDDLVNAPLISEEYANIELHPVNILEFQREQRNRDTYTEDYNSSQGSAMLSRFDDTEIVAEDVILTARRSLQREILVAQLGRWSDLANFDFHNSPYFSRYILHLNTQGMHNPNTFLGKSVEYDSSSKLAEIEGDGSDKMVQTRRATVTEGVMGSVSGGLSLGFEVANNEDDGDILDPEELKGSKFMFRP